MQKAGIILGIKLLEQVKPYNIEHTQLSITYNREKLFLRRALTRYENICINEDSSRRILQ